MRGHPTMRNILKCLHYFFDAWTAAANTHKVSGPGDIHHADDETAHLADSTALDSTVRVKDCSKGLA